MPLSSELTQSILIEKHTKTGSFVYSYQSNKTTWSENLPTILGLEKIRSLPCAEFEMPCFAEHTKQIIKNRINTNRKNRISIDIKIPAKANPNNTAQEKKWFRYVCEFIETTDGMCRIGFFQDISHSIELKEQNSFFQDRIQMALSASHTGTWDYHVVSNELFWDSRTHDIFETKVTTRPMNLATWLTYLHTDSQSAFLASFNVVDRKSHDDELLGQVFKFTTVHGEEKFVSINAHFYRDELDQIVRIVGTCRDVTDNETQTNCLLEQATLAQKNEMLAQDAIAARTRFIANVSHEVRTPLNAVMGALQILHTFDFNDEITNILDMASSASHELLNTLNDILDLSKVDAHKLDIEQIDINVSQLINNAIQKYEPQLHEQVKIAICLPENFDKNRLGDPVRFNQVINNLLSNAVKFTLEGSITVTVNADAHGIEVSVRDTGIGIEEDKIKLIFEPFRQSDESTTRQFGGSGLGLSISQALVKLMGGELKANSQINAGSEFRFKLPMPIIGEHVTSLGDNKLSDTVPDLSHQHILYVEDDDASIEVVKQLVRPSNARLNVAIDGKQALEMYRKNKSISLIILDLEIPLINGMQVCEKIRKEDRKIAIVALSKNVTISDQKIYFNAGFTHIIEKPIMFDDFYSVLATI